MAPTLDPRPLVGSFFLPAVLVLSTLILVLSASRRPLTAGPFSINGGLIAQQPILCIYPISGQYGFLPRLLYYILIVFGVTFHHHDWLVAGALASALSYAGTASIHALLLAGFARQATAWDFDILACAAITSVAVTVVTPLFRFSKTWKFHRAKYVVILWFILVGSGLICSTYAAWSMPAAEPPCVNSRGHILTNAVDGLTDATFNCTYKCLTTRQHFRDTNELEAMETVRLESPVSIKGVSLGFMIIPILMLCCIYILDLLLYRWWGKNHYDGTLQKPKQVVSILISIVFIATILAWEIAMLLPPALPVGEAYYAIGQWAPWVVVGLVLIAALVVRGKQDGQSPLGEDDGAQEGASNDGGETGQELSEMPPLTDNENAAGPRPVSPRNSSSTTLDPEMGVAVTTVESARSR